ncbi:LysM peptidoglycan-binding domain-containing protein [Singulisphaera sp. PoT]|uniref:LysM peptidoglycan-binding domain-containing protein n=1 Tax=Singulisphaera sp. PoT TaxID=3411797 RepID=UPI003BF59CEC
MSAIQHPHHGDDEPLVHEGSVVIETSHQLGYEPEQEDGHEHEHNPDLARAPRKRFRIPLAQLNPGAVVKLKRETRFGLAVVISFGILMGVLIFKKGTKTPPTNQIKSVSNDAKKPNKPTNEEKPGTSPPPATSQTTAAPTPTAEPAQAAAPTPAPEVASKPESEEDPLQLPTASHDESHVKLASNEEPQSPVPPAETAKPTDPMVTAHAGTATPSSSDATPKESLDANHAALPIPPPDPAAKGTPVAAEAPASPPVDPHLAASTPGTPIETPSKDPAPPAEGAAGAVAPAAAAGAGALEVTGAGQTPPAVEPSAALPSAGAPATEPPVTPAQAGAGSNVANSPMPLPGPAEAAPAPAVAPEAPAAVTTAPASEATQSPATPSVAPGLEPAAAPAPGTAPNGLIPGAHPAEGNLPPANMPETVPMPGSSGLTGAAEPLPAAPAVGAGALALPAAGIAAGAGAAGAEMLSNAGHQQDGKVNDIPNLDQPPVASGTEAPAPTEAPAAGMPSDLVPIPNAGQRPFSGETIVSSEPEMESTSSTTPILDAIPVSTPPADPDRIQPEEHVVRSGENFWTISREYYRSGRYYKALWKANQKLVAAPEDLAVGMTIIVPPPEELDKHLILPPQSAKRTEAIDPPSAVRKTSAQNVGSSPKGRTLKNAPEVELALPDMDGDSRRRSNTYTPPSDDYEGEEPERGNYRRYRIRRGDSLRKIAREKLGTARRANEIFELNRDILDSPNDNLIPGQDISLPDN